MPYSPKRPNTLTLGRRIGVTFPCKDCQKRQVGCHSNCEDYLCVKNAMLEEKRKFIQSCIEEKRFEDYLVKEKVKNMKKNKRWNRES